VTTRDIATRLRAELANVPARAERLADGESQLTTAERVRAILAYEAGCYRGVIETAIADLDSLARHETATKRTTQREAARVKREAKLAVERPAAYVTSARLKVALGEQDV
jgi:hypothetical protein